MDWREFVISTTVAKGMSDALEDAPFIEWYCSSFTGSPEYEVYGSLTNVENGAKNVFDAILIRQ
jgi:hypothetical protein